MRTFRTKIETGKMNNAGSVFRKQTRLFPFSMMKRYEFMELKFQGKHKNVYMHQVEHGKNYLSVFSAINQALVILKAVFGIKQMGRCKKLSLRKKEIDRKLAFRAIGF